MSINNQKKEKHWIVKSKNDAVENAAVARLSGELGIHPIVARLLHNRGYRDVASAKAFIYMESEMILSPWLMKDMDKAVERIRLAVERGEKITVYGDYDVDGVTSVCTLYLYLKGLGAKVDYYIPNRAGEGYGVSRSAINTLSERATTLIITVDTGITASDEVAYARELGIDFLITDHHECREELPTAVAVINPHRPDCPYPFKELAGVGVVFKLICAYEERAVGRTPRDAARKMFREYSDLVAIGTIADVMPIMEENRIIVKYGLDMIERTERIGLRALIDATQSKSDGQRSSRKKKPKITSGYIGYTLAPRINAAGRIKSAEMAVELFLSEDRAEALAIAQDLCRANKERQTEENKIMKEAYEKIGACNIEEDPVIVLDADNWHHGVIGIVSSRITEKYSRPSILVSFEGNDAKVASPDDIGKGSGRSIKGMNLVDALYHCSDTLVKFGGHELAAGLSVTREALPEFRRRINEYAKANLTEEDLTPSLDADVEIEFSDINLSLAKSLLMLEPFGVANPVPVLVLRGANLVEISGVSDGKHTKLTIGDGRHVLTAMYFSVSPDSLGLYVGDKIDLLFNLDINEWGDRESVQIIVRDVKRSASAEELIRKEKERFDEVRAGAAFSEEEGIMPSRDDFAAVYKLMLMSQRAGVDTLTHRDIISKLSANADGQKIGYAKLKVIIMVFRELNLLNIEETEDEVYKFSIHYTSSKTELDKSTLLRRLRQQLIRA